MYLQLVDDAGLRCAELRAPEFIRCCIGALLQFRDLCLGFAQILEHVGAEILVELQDLQLRLGENSSRLDVVSDAGTEKFVGSKLNERIRDTSVTYEDLAFKFLYWPAARVLGEEKVRTRNCWKLQLRAPSRESQYSNVLLWVDKASGALMRMEGYDWNAQLAKRFEVVSAQKIEERWFLKQMRIEEFKPGTSHVEARTYLEIKK